MLPLFWNWTGAWPIGWGSRQGDGLQLTLSNTLHAAFQKHVSSAILCWWANTKHILKYSIFLGIENEYKVLIFWSIFISLFFWSFYWAIQYEENYKWGKRRIGTLSISNELNLKNLTSVLCAYWYVQYNCGIDCSWYCLPRKRQRVTHAIKVTWQDNWDQRYQYVCRMAKK